MLEKAYYIQNLEDVESLPKEAERVYVGSEYCVNAFPDDFNSLLTAAKIYPISMLTPPVLESDIPSFNLILNAFETFARNDDEIIINDWGLFSQLRNKKRHYKIRIGTFLTYQRRGTQRRYDIVRDETLTTIPVLDDKMLTFLKNNGVSGIDIDLPLYSPNIKLVSPLSLAAYLPYALNSYTINCPFTFNGKSWGRSCARNCVNLKLFFKNDETGEPFFQKGKAYFTNSHPVKDTSLIDRLVYFEWKR